MKTKKIVFLMHLCQHTMQDNYIRESDNPNRFPPLKKIDNYLFIDTTSFQFNSSFLNRKQKLVDMSQKHIFKLLS